MVLAAHGLEISEVELRALCDCTFDGTSGLKAVDAARQLGFPGSSKDTLSINESANLVSQGHSPIVFVEMSPINGIYQVHALVVINLSEFAVQVYDPARSKRLIPLDIFYLAWKLRRHLTVIVAR